MNRVYILRSTVFSHFEQQPKVERIDVTFRWMARRVITDALALEGKSLARRRALEIIRLNQARPDLKFILSSRLHRRRREWLIQHCKLAYGNDFLLFL